MAASRPRIAEEVTVCELDGEAVVYDPRGHQLHYLNHAPALVLDLCDGSATLRDMAAEIADVFEMPTDDVEKQVRKIVRELRGRDLLVPTSPSKPEVDGEDRPRPLAEILADERGTIRMQVPRSS